MEARIFQKKILAWYRREGRHTLPWRLPAGRQAKNFNPYHILVSEIMLQQTQVPRVIQKYGEFLKAFPDAASLACARTSAVLRVWQGLGYNRRALHLQKAACAVLPRFPREVEALKALPGVGDYTARAIRTFAWNKSEVFLETNIRRVFIHFFFPRISRVADSRILPLVEKTLYTKDPRMWYWALMDYGAGALKDIPNPNRRSRHHARQSRFPGSRRYARAKILQFLLNEKKVTTLSKIRSYSDADPYLKPRSRELGTILKDLAREGFLGEARNGWHIK